MNAQEQALEEKMEARLAEYSKVRKKVPKDGACMFRCVAEEMYGSQSFHRLLREQCVKYMRTNAETFLPFVVGCSDLPWDHYLFELQKVETWGGYLELMALSKMLKVNFTIYTEISAPTIVDQGFPSSVSLAFSGGNHYDLVRNKDRIGVYSYCQELVYNIVQQITCPGETLDSTKQEYKNIAYECWIEDLKKQESRDKLITTKLNENPQQYTGLTGYYKKESSPKVQAKEPPKSAKKHRNKKGNKQQAPVHSPFSVAAPVTPAPPAPQLSAEELELQSILSQIEEVEKKQLGHISFNRDFPEFKPKPKPPTSTPSSVPSDSPTLNPSSTSTSAPSPALNPTTTSSTIPSSTTSPSTISSTIPSSPSSSSTSSAAPSTAPPTATPSPAPVNAWKSPKSWTAEQKK